MTATEAVRQAIKQYVVHETNGNRLIAERYTEAKRRRLGLNVKAIKRGDDS